MCVQQRAFSGARIAEGCFQRAKIKSLPAITKHRCLDNPKGMVHDVRETTFHPFYFLFYFCDVVVALCVEFVSAGCFVRGSQNHCQGLRSSLSCRGCRILNSQAQFVSLVKSLGAYAVHLDGAVMHGVLGCYLMLV